MAYLSSFTGPRILPSPDAVRLCRLTSKWLAVVLIARVLHWWTSRRQLCGARQLASEFRAALGAGGVESWRASGWLEIDPNDHRVAHLLADEQRLAALLLVGDGRGRGAGLGPRLVRWMLLGHAMLDQLGFYLTDGLHIGARMLADRRQMAMVPKMAEGVRLFRCRAAVASTGQQHQKRPVVLFVPGGAWGSCDPAHYYHLCM